MTEYRVDEMSTCAALMKRFVITILIAEGVHIFVHFSLELVAQLSEVTVTSEQGQARELILCSEGHCLDSDSDINSRLNLHIKAILALCAFFVWTENLFTFECSDVDGESHFF